ncbi:MAG: Asp23/Gls24 family envelope stress response protein [Candidatus Gygaella obscura]|nr:Asp23/Gls24 family envelope stress response protein [Candidatus Gygaella obscura]
MKPDSTKTALGNIKIHKNVISSTCSIASLDTEGVSALCTKPGDELLKIINKEYKPGIKISIDKNNEVIINISIIVKYGYNLSQVASKVQENARLAIDKIVDVNIKDINVIVKGLERR